MTDDDKALVERLRSRAKWLEPELDVMDENEVLAAANRIEAQAAEIEQWRECALYDATMEGPVFKGWNRSALDRCRRAALEARGLEIREKGQ